MRRILVSRTLTLLLAVILVGCSSGQLADDAPSGDEAPSASEATAESTPTAVPTPDPTPTRQPTPRPTPKPEASVRKGEQIVIAWQPEYSDRYVDYQVIIEVINDGTGWAELSAFNSDYTIFNTDGGIVTTGGFIYAYPEYVGPGETAYLVSRAGIGFMHKGE